MLITFYILIVLFIIFLEPGKSKIRTWYYNYACGTVSELCINWLGAWLGHKLQMWQTSKFHVPCMILSSSWMCYANKWFLCVSHVVERSIHQIALLHQYFMAIWLWKSSPLDWLLDHILNLIASGWQTLHTCVFLFLKFRSRIWYFYSSLKCILICVVFLFWWVVRY